MSAGPAAEAVATALEAVAPQVGDSTGGQVLAIRDRVAGPFVVALAGRVKAGKSTLVNALLGRAVAPTAATECTRVVTRYSFGPHEKAVVVTYQGDQIVTPLDADGGLPTELPVPVDLVDHVQVTLPVVGLHDLELVDTPGLSTVRVENSGRTEAFLGLDRGSKAACRVADALVFLVNSAVRDDDAEALRRFVAACGERSGVATVAVLNKADQVQGGFTTARQLAGRHAEALGPLASAMVPLAGLVAATARAGSLDADDLVALATLAALPRPELDVLLTDLSLFCELDAPVPPERRQRLARLLSLHGLGIALDAMRTGTADMASLTVTLLARCGYGQLDGALARIRRRADAIKARSAITALEAVAYGADAPPADAVVLRSALAEMTIRPALHALNELAVLDAIVAKAVRFDRNELIELDRLFTCAPAAARLGAPPRAPVERLAALAWDGATRWQGATHAPVSPVQRHAAGVVQRSYVLLWERLVARGDPSHARSSR